MTRCEALDLTDQNVEHSVWPMANGSPNQVILIFLLALAFLLGPVSLCARIRRGQIQRKALQSLVKRPFRSLLRNVFWCVRRLILSPVMLPVWEAKLIGGKSKATLFCPWGILTYLFDCSVDYCEYVKLSAKHGFKTILRCMKKKCIKRTLLILGLNDSPHGDVILPLLACPSANPPILLLSPALWYNDYHTVNYWDDFICSIKLY